MSIDKNIIWIDDNDNDLEEVSLPKAHKEGLLHRISVVYVINNEGKILVQKRVDGRLDHSAAGHVDVGESYFEAAKRELEEELGIKTRELNEIGDCSSSESSGKIRHKFKVFGCKESPIKLNPEEVAEIFWTDPKNVWKDMQKDNKNKKYCGGFKSTLELYLKLLR